MLHLVFCEQDIKNSKTLVLKEDWQLSFNTLIKKRKIFPVSAAFGCSNCCTPYWRFKFTGNYMIQNGSVHHPLRSGMGDNIKPGFGMSACHQTEFENNPILIKPGFVLRSEKLLYLRLIENQVLNASSKQINRFF